MLSRQYHNAALAPEMLVPGKIILGKGPSGKMRPLMIYARFKDPKDNQIAALMLAVITTQIPFFGPGDLYRPKEAYFQAHRNDSQNAIIRLGHTEILPLKPELFNFSRGVIGQVINKGVDLSEAMLARRADALLFEPRRQHVMASNLRYDEDWIYEGPIFEMASHERGDPFNDAPDIAGAVKNQRLFYPPWGIINPQGMKDRIARVLDEARAEKRWRFLSRDELFRALSDGEDPHELMKSEGWPSGVLKNYGVSDPRLAPGG